MPQLLTADTCPSCGAIHGQPTDWPTCRSTGGEHEHLMYEIGLSDEGWLYACHAWQCDHKHTQKERATMTATNEAAGAVLAIREDQSFWDARQLAALTHLGVEDASRADLGVFFHRCQVTGLDPFANQICMIKRGGKWTIQTEIDGLRVIAKRAAEREGVDISYGPTRFKNGAGGWEEEPWIGDDPPLGAAVTVYKSGRPFHGSARYKSFVQLKDGKPVRQWATMPDLMIAKCAEAQALRKAFPHDLEAIVTSDEAAHTIPAPQARVNDVSAPAGAWRADVSEWREATPTEEPEKQVRPVPRIARGDVEGLYRAIGAQFAAIGIEAAAEQKSYTYKLANKEEPEEGVDALTERDLRFALDSLARCADLAALVELCAPEPATP